MGLKGSSGVGKSFFYAYCVFRLTQEPIDGRVLVFNCADRFYVFEDNAFRYLSTDEEIELYRYNKNMIRLIDGQSSKLLSWSGVSILFSSPDSPGYKQFMSYKSVEYVMPPWTPQELKVASEITDTSADEVSERFGVFGGNARLVFSKTPVPDIDDIVGKLSMKDTVQLVTAANMQAVDKFPSILQMFPKHLNNRPYCGVEMSFASRRIAEKSYEKMQASCHGNLMSLLFK